jgi:hypothetical protein
VRWFHHIDPFRCYLAGLPAGPPIDASTQPTRKQVYAMVGDGMRVARIGDTTPRLDKRNRAIRGRMVFCAEWADEYLTGKASGGSHPGPVAVDLRRSA